MDERKMKQRDGGKGPRKRLSCFLQSPGKERLRRERNHEPNGSMCAHGQAVVREARGSASEGAIAKKTDLQATQHDDICLDRI
jgi:hypothetical protein